MFRNQNSDILTTQDGKRYYSTLIYPEIQPHESDWYVITTVGDRMDLLANEYYGDPTLWWIIYVSNFGLPRDSVYLPLGIQIRIPANAADIIAKFNEVNNAR